MYNYVIGGERMNNVPTVACINDLSGYGRCSLSTAIPILSVCGVQPCAAPTAVFSKHTGFPDFHFTDLSDSLDSFLSSWNDLNFDGVYTGFLGSHLQIDVVYKFIEMHKKLQTKPPLVVVDTVMGDNGKLYSTYNQQMCDCLKKLVSVADVITPNVTEACFLTNTEYTGDSISDDRCKHLAEKLTLLGAKSVVITGIRRDNSVLNYVCNNKDYSIYEVHRVNRIFSGTGDLFASVLTAMLIKGKSLSEAVVIAGDFICKATQHTLNVSKDYFEGIVFEPFLSELGE